MLLSGIFANLIGIRWLVFPIVSIGTVMCVHAQWEYRAGGNLVQHTGIPDVQFLVGVDHFNSDRTSIGFDVVVDPGIPFGNNDVRLLGSDLGYTLNQRYYGVHYRSTYYTNHHDKMYSGYIASVLGMGLMDQRYKSETQGRTDKNASTILVTLGLRVGIRASEKWMNRIYAGGGFNVLGKSNLPRSVTQVERISTIYGELGYVIGGTW